MCTNELPFAYPYKKSILNSPTPELPKRYRCFQTILNKYFRITLLKKMGYFLSILLL